MDAHDENKDGSHTGQLQVLWPGIVENLPPNQRMWLTTSQPLMLAENTAVVAVPNEFTRTQLEGRLRTRIEDALSDQIGKPVRLVVSVDTSLERTVPPAEDATPATVTPLTPREDAPEPSAPRHRRDPCRRIDRTTNRLLDTETCRQRRAPRSPPASPTAR